MHRGSMSRRCEVCESLAPDGPAPRRLSRFLVQNRVVALCAEHAETFRAVRPETLQAVADLFREPTGQRSLLTRRAPVERRQFPMRPEGRRRNGGRRRSDAA
jgi:hypothetical protein